MMDGKSKNNNMFAGHILESEGKSKGRHKEIAANKLGKGRPACLNFSTYMFN